MESDNNDSVVVERGEWREMGYFHEEQVDISSDVHLNLTTITLKISCNMNISGRELDSELHQDIKTSNSFTHRPTATD